MTKIYLIRHAEAEGNIHRRAHGQFNGQIIGRGYQQIELLRERFKDVKIDAVYSSDLDRTCATAAPICRQHGLAINKTAELREVNMGIWEDVAWGDLEYQYPEMSRFFSIDPARWHVSGSEDYFDVRTRMTECIVEIARRYDGGTVAVFSHGFAIRAFICGVLGIRSDEVEKVLYCDNTAVALLRYENETLSLEFQSDNSHLSSEISTFANQTWWRAEKEWLSENLRYMKSDNNGYQMFPELSVCDSRGDFIADSGYTAFLANEPLGVIGLNENKGSNEGIGWISYIYIKPEFQRKGYGIQLLGYAISVFRRLRREKLRVEVRTDGAALAFYSKFEFEITGRTETRCFLEKNIRNW